MGQKRRFNTHNLGIQKYRIESCQIQKCQTFSLTAFLYIFLRIRHTEIVMLKWRSFMKRKFGMADKLGYMFGDFGNDFAFI